MNVEALKSIITYEANLIALGKSYRDWEWHNVNISPATLRKLVLEGYLEVTHSSNKKTYYQLKDHAGTKKNVEEFEMASTFNDFEEIGSEIEIPSDLFDTIIGFDDLKDLFKTSIKSEKPVSFLLTGSPGVAKTVFLLEISRLKGAFYLLGGSTSKSGLSDQLFNLFSEGDRCILLIDEIDKMDKTNFTILLSLMETGIVKVVKTGKTKEMRLNCSVFGACNRSNKIPPENLDRFEEIVIPEYSEEEANQVIVNILTIKEGCTKEHAKTITSKLKRKSIRHAIRIARLTSTSDDVDRLLNTLKKYRGE